MADATNDELREQVGRLQSAQAVDPTLNVLEHVRSAVQRLDDLRSAESRYLREVGELAREHIKEMGAIRALHFRELAAAEKERLDAIRAIDAQAINLADSKLNALGERLQQSFASTATLLQTRISDIERRQYETAGAKEHQTESRQQNQWGVGVGMGFLGLGIAVAGIVIALSNP